MSVLASHRSRSKFEVIVYASEVRRKMRELAERDFGLRNYDVYSCRYYSMEKGVEAAREKHRKLLEDFAYRMELSAFKLTANVRAANSIYPKSMEEYEQRRAYQNRAIANCEQLIEELQHIVEFFDVDVNIFKECVEAIDREIGLIKDWRRSDNKFKSKLRATSENCVTSSTNFANVNNNGNANNNNASNSNGVRPDSL